MSYSRSRPGDKEDRFRDIGTAAAAMLALFLVLLSVFIYISRLDLAELAEDRGAPASGTVSDPPIRAASSGDSTEVDAPVSGGSRSEGAPSSTDGRRAEPDEVEGTIEGSSNIGLPDVSNAANDEARIAAPSAEAAQWSQSLGDRGYQVRIPAGWRQASVNEAAPPLRAADHDLVLEEPNSGARIAVSIWDASELVPLVLWAPSVAEGMRPVDGQWAQNAVLAGEPAMLLWAQETPISPARYAAFVGHAGRYLRLAYSASDGGEALDSYAQLLNSLRWSDAVDATDVGDRLPPLPMPRPRYHPSGRLFEGAAPTR